LKKGVTLIELVVVVALGTILLSIASLSVARVREERVLVEARSKIEGLLRLYAERAYNDGDEYTITLDYEDKNIKVEDRDMKILDRLELPENLKYTTIISNTKQTTQVATAKGSGWTTSFSIYIFDFSEKGRYRISVDGINPSNLTHINVYKNKRADVTWDNVVSYDFNEGKWEKE